MENTEKHREYHKRPLPERHAAEQEQTAGYYGKGQSLFAGGGSAVEYPEDKIREKQQSGAVENDAVSDMRFVLFAHRVASFAFVQGYGIFSKMSISAEIMIDNTRSWLLLWWVETRCAYGTVTETN